MVDEVQLVDSAAFSDAESYWSVVVEQLRDGLVWRAGGSLQELQRGEGDAVAASERESRLSVNGDVWGEFNRETVAHVEVACSRPAHRGASSTERRATLVETRP